MLESWSKVRYECYDNFTASDWLVVADPELYLIDDDYSDKGDGTLRMGKVDPKSH